MAVTQNTYTGNGSTQNYVFSFTYLDPSHVKASINGTPTTDFTFFNASTLRFNTAPANGAAIRIYRETPSDNLLADYTAGSALREQDLELTLQQVLNVAQETQTFAENQSTTGLQAQITIANNNANLAVTTANAASATANGLAASITTANTNASNAVTTANNASTTAGNAVTTANNAQTTANAALSRAGGTMTGNITFANTQPITGISLNSGQFGGYRNRIINGQFRIAERANGGSSNGYVFDRWRLALQGSGATVSQQATALGNEGVQGNPKTFCRTVVTSVANAANFVRLTHNIESVRSFTDETITLSFFARATGITQISTEFSQNFGTGGSPSASVSFGVTKHNLTTAWTRYTVTVAVPNIGARTLGTNGDDSLQLNIWLDAGSNFNTQTSTLGQASKTVDITSVQVERGSLATNYEERTDAEEATLCLRFFERVPQIGLGGYNLAGLGAFQFVQFKSLKRRVPTIGVTSITNVNCNVASAVDINTSGFTYFTSITSNGSYESKATITADADY